MVNNFPRRGQVGFQKSRRVRPDEERYEAWEVGGMGDLRLYTDSPLDPHGSFVLRQEATVGAYSNVFQVIDGEAVYVGRLF